MPERVRSHPTIQRFRSDNVRFKTVHAGRRSWKTETAKRTLIAACLSRTPQNPGNYFFGAPTAAQVKRIAWEDFVQLSEPHLVKSINNTDMCIKYWNDSTLWAVGCDKPARIEGSPWHGFVLSESADIKKGIWADKIQPMVRDTGGWGIFEGVPEGKNWFYELCEYARTSGDPEWMDYCWKSVDVLNPDEIAKAKETTDARTFRQEYEGSFESYEGRAHPYFETDTHCRNLPELLIGSHYSLFVACDFNIDPHIWEIGQDNKDCSYVHEEIVQKQSDVWKMSAECKRRLIALYGGNESRARENKLIFYGDYQQGTGRMVSATSSTWQILREQFGGWNCEFRIRSNPRITDRVNAVNARQRDASGKVRFKVNPSCVELIKDFNQISLADYSAVDQGERTHAASAVGYMIAYEYPIMPKATAVQYKP